MSAPAGRMWTASILVMLAVATWLRFHGLSTQFAQMDDLFPIAGPYVANQGRPKTVPVPYTAGRFSVTVDTHRIKTNAVLYAAYVSTATYAPLRFAFLPLVLSGDYDYRTFLLRGRLPSAICSALALAASSVSSDRCTGVSIPARCSASRRLPCR